MSPELVLGSFILLILYVYPVDYPPVEELVKQCGKFGLLDRLLTHLKAQKHKVRNCHIHVYAFR